MKDASVMDAASGLVAAIRAYEKSEATRPALTLLGESEVQAFLGTMPTLSDHQLEIFLAAIVQEKQERALREERRAQTGFWA